MPMTWDDLIDDLHSWEEVQLQLGGRWREVLDRSSGAVLSTHVDELLAQEPARGTATQRRLLHQRGFRRRDRRCWSWTPPEPSSGDLAPAPPGWPARMAAAWRSAEREGAIDRARSAMALEVLREVYRCSPDDLEICVASDQEEDEGEDDDDEDVDGADSCAALQARFGPGRRRAT